MTGIKKSGKPGFPDFQKGVPGANEASYIS